MTRWNVALGGGTVAVLAVLTVSVVRSVREVLSVERDRRRRGLLVTPPRVAGGGQSADGSSPVPVAAGAPPSGIDEQVRYVDDEIAATVRRIIRDQGLVP